MEKEIFILEERLSELQSRKELTEEYSIKIKNRYESWKNIMANMKEFKYFAQKKDFTSNEFIIFKLKGFRTKIKLDKQLQTEYLIDSQIFIETKISDVQKLFINRENDEQEMSVYEDFIYQYMHPLKSLTFIVVLLTSTPAFTQTLTNPFHLLQEKGEWIYGLDNRRTKINGQHATIYGLYTGVGFGNKLRCKIQVSGLPFERSTSVDDDGLVKSIDCCISA